MDREGFVFYTREEHRFPSLHLHDIGPLHGETGPVSEIALRPVNRLVFYEQPSQCYVGAEIMGYNNVPFERSRSVVHFSNYGEPTPTAHFGFQPVVLVTSQAGPLTWMGPQMPTRTIVSHPVRPPWCVCAQRVPVHQPSNLVSSPPERAVSQNVTPQKQSVQKASSEVGHPNVETVEEQVKKEEEPFQSLDKETVELLDELFKDDGMFLEELCSEVGFVRNVDSTLNMDYWNSLMSSDPDPLDLFALERGHREEEEAHLKQTDPNDSRSHTSSAETPLTSLDVLPGLGTEDLELLSSQSEITADPTTLTTATVEDKREECLELSDSDESDSLLANPDEGVLLQDLETEDSEKIAEELPITTSDSDAITSATVKDKSEVQSEEGTLLPDPKTSPASSHASTCEKVTGLKVDGEGENGLDSEKARPVGSPLLPSHLLELTSTAPDDRTGLFDPLSDGSAYLNLDSPRESGLDPAPVTSDLSEMFLFKPKDDSYLLSEPALSKQGCGSSLPALSEAFLGSDSTEQPEKENGDETTSQEELTVIQDDLTVAGPVQESSIWVGLESNRRDAEPEENPTADEEILRLEQQQGTQRLVREGRDRGLSKRNEENESKRMKTTVPMRRSQRLSLQLKKVCGEVGEMRFCQREVETREQTLQRRNENGEENAEVMPPQSASTEAEERGGSEERRPNIKEEGQTVNVVKRRSESTAAKAKSPPPGLRPRCRSLDRDPDLKRDTEDSVLTGLNVESRESQKWSPMKRYRQEGGDFKDNETRVKKRTEEIEKCSPEKKPKINDSSGNEGDCDMSVRKDRVRRKLCEENW